MTAPAVDPERLRALLRAVEREDKLGIVRELLAHFINDYVERWQDELHLYANMLSSRRGTLNGAYAGLCETIQRLQLRTHHVPSPRNVSRAFKLYGRKSAHEADLETEGTLQLPVDYHRNALDKDGDAAFDAAVAAARRLGVLRDRGFCIGHDGSRRPFYGESHDFGRNGSLEQAHADDGSPLGPKKMSIAGSRATAAFRKVGGHAQPMDAGTKVKHDFFQANLQVYDTDEVLPLRIRQTPETPASVGEMIDAVEALEVKPMFWFADKAFSKEKLLHRVREATIRHRIVLMQPISKNSRIQNLVEKNWNNGTAQRAYADGDVFYWWAQPYVINETGNGSREHRRSEPFTLLTLYFEGKPGDNVDQPEETVISLDENLYAVCFLLNVEVTSENVVWMHAQYGRRWGATENVFKRAKAYTGTSFSQGMFGRHVAYLGDMLTLSAYALWRMERRLRLGLDAGVSHVAFYADLHRQTEERLLAYLPLPPTMEAPPLPFEAGPKKRRTFVVAQPQTEAAVPSYA